MAELLPEKLGQAEDSYRKAGEGEPRKRKRLRVASALQWVHTYISVIAQQQPARVIDLLGYASLVVHKFKGEGWLQYDRNFRKYAETHSATRWAEANTSLWSLAFCNAPLRPVLQCGSRDIPMRGVRPTRGTYQTKGRVTFASPWQNPHL